MKSVNFGILILCGCLLAACSTSRQPSASVAAPPTEAQVSDPAPPSSTGNVVLRNFLFRQGGSLPELRLHYATWGRPVKNTSDEVTNAIVLLHGTGGSWKNFSRPLPSRNRAHPLLGPGAPFDTNRFFVVAPDAIGSGASSKPSDGQRMQFPAYDLSDMVAASKLLLEELGVRRALAVAGTSMGGREAWQFAVQFPNFMSAVIPMIASPFPNAGRRAFVDLLPQAIILRDPAFAGGNYRANPPAVQIAEHVYDLLGSSASEMQGRFPSRESVRAAIFDDEARYDDDACDFLYQLRLNNGYDAWAQFDRVRARVFMINMADDLLVPIELGHNRRAANRLRDATYLEIPATGYGHGGLMRTIDVWGPKLSRWIARIDLNTHFHD